MNELDRPVHQQHLKDKFVKHFYILIALLLIAPFASADEPLRERIEWIDIWVTELENQSGQTHRDAAGRESLRRLEVPSLHC